MRRFSLAYATAVLALAPALSASAVTLTNGTGDGQVSITLDDFGTAGSGNGVYNPVGPGTAASTVFESRIYLGFGGARSTPSGSVTVGTSTATRHDTSWTFGTAFDFSLSQVLTDLVNGSNVQVGSQLTQTYTITNTSGGPVTFDVIRYLDGDLAFDGSISDGGGRLTGGTEILFETDTATGSADAATFVGITATGGVIPTSGRFEIDSYSGLSSRMASGTLPDDIITGDGIDADSFIDAGGGYDVTLALRNVFSLGIGETATYTTTTIWGTGTPEETQDIVDEGNSVPLPPLAAMLGLGALLIGLGRRR